MGKNYNLARFGFMPSFEDANKPRHAFDVALDDLIANARIGFVAVAGQLLFKESLCLTTSFCPRSTFPKR